MSDEEYDDDEDDDWNGYYDHDDNYDDDDDDDWNGCYDDDDDDDSVDFVPKIDSTKDYISKTNDDKLHTSEKDKLKTIGTDNCKLNNEYKKTNVVEINENHKKEELGLNRSAVKMSVENIFQTTAFDVDLENDEFNKHIDPQPNNSQHYEILSKNKEKWLCKICTLLNKYDDFICETCQSERKDHGIWICEQCDYINIAAVSQCEVCGQINFKSKSTVKRSIQQDIKFETNKYEQCGNKINNEYGCTNQIGSQAQPIQRTSKSIFTSKKSVSSITETNVERNPKTISNKLNTKNVNKSKDSKNIEIGSTTCIQEHGPKYTSRSKHLGQWMCILCLNWHLCNDLFCKICSIEKDKCGIWICLRCQIPTSVRFNKCDKCYPNRPQKSVDTKKSQEKELNDNKLENKIDNYESNRSNTAENLMKNKDDICVVNQQNWNCWNSHCKQLNTADCYFCNTCKLQRLPPTGSNDFVKKLSKRKIKEIWICQKCAAHNQKQYEQCQKNRCGALRFSRESSEINDERYNECAERNENNMPKMNIIDNLDLWKCNYCKKSNKLKNDYCEYCCLHRYGSCERGVAVQIMSRNRNKKIWICNSCHKHNELHVSHCAGKRCSQTRFDLNNN